MEGVAKLAPFNPTPSATVEAALDLAAVGPGDTVVDLGCGDGRTLVAAAKRGARALGIEYDPELHRRAIAAVREVGMASLVEVHLGDASVAQPLLEQATVVFLYLVPDGLRRLRPMLDMVRQRARVVSYTFSVPGWVPDREVALRGLRLRLYGCMRPADGPRASELLHE